MFGNELDFQEDLLRTRVLTRVANLFRTRFVTIFATSGTALLPTLLLHIVIPPMLQEFLSFTFGFLGTLLGYYAIQHLLSQFPESPPVALFHSFRSGLVCLPRIIVLGLRTLFGVFIGLLLLVVPGIQRMCSWYVAHPSNTPTSPDQDQLLSQLHFRPFETHQINPRRHGLANLVASVP